MIQMQQTQQETIKENKNNNITITKDMTIGAVVSKYPAAIEPLQEAGVHCVGCHVSYTETLEQGFKGHGMTDGEIDKVVENINRAIAESDEQGETPFIVTKKAAEQLKKILKENNVEGSGLRVDIVPGGCSGFEYSLELDDSIMDSDEVIEEKGVKIIINNEHISMLKGAKIDFVDSLQGGGFKITNPNTASSCGCGQSFGY